MYSNNFNKYNTISYTKSYSFVWSSKKIKKQVKHDFHGSHVLLAFCSHGSHVLLAYLFIFRSHVLLAICLFLEDHKKIMILKNSCIPTNLKNIQMFPEI